jgi:radical SAM protein with 4Fe4S-binding SPASM domain
MNHTDHPSRPLRMLFWESTARCNLTCKHCRRLDDTDIDDLSTNEFRSVLDSAKTLGNPVVVFSGGEPLMRNDWETLAQYATRLDLPVALATNGTLITADIASRIAGAGFRRVSVSLDGADAATHDAFRNLPGAMDAALAGIGHLKNAGVPFQINASIAAHNADQLDELYALTRELGAVALHLFLLVPVGCGVEIEESHQLSASRYEDVLGWVCDHLGGDMELRATCAPHLARVAEAKGVDLGHHRGCLAGSSVIFVSHRGEVFPCGYLPVSCGSVREHSLASIWRESPLFAQLASREDLQGACGGCSLKSHCGGCRARALGATGDLWSPDPACLRSR